MPNDDPFSAFKPTEAPKTPIESFPIVKAKRGRKPVQKRDRKEIKAEAELARTGNGSVMVPIGAISACRHLTDDEIKFTIAVAGGISELPKKAQQHVVEALAKIFS